MARSGFFTVQCDIPSHGQIYLHTEQGIISRGKAVKIGPEKIAEFAHDLQSGLARRTVPQFDRIPVVGMASILALHIRGLGEIEYGVLRQVADYYFDIPATALPEALRVLAEVEFIQLISKGPTSIKSIIPQVPHFSSIASGLGGYISAMDLTEHEQLSVAILNELTHKAEKRESLFARLGAEKLAFETTEKIVVAGGLVVPKRMRGHSVWVSPAYFADNLDAVAELAAAGRAPRVARLLKLLEDAQGWPLSMIQANMEIAGTKITTEDFALLQSLVADGILKPPSVERPKAAAEYFVFTPRPGNTRLDISRREIYERAMALVAAVRKGQLLPEVIRIRSPVAILNALMSKKMLNANTDAKSQYGNLVALQVGTLVKGRSDRYEFHLIDSDENMEAVREALALVSKGYSGSGSLKNDARLALTQDERYIQSIAAAAKLKQTDSIPLEPEAVKEIEQMLLNLK